MHIVENPQLCARNLQMTFELNIAAQLHEANLENISSKTNTEC